MERWQISILLVRGDHCVGDWFDNIWTWIHSLNLTFDIRWTWNIFLSWRPTLLGRIVIWLKGWDSDFVNPNPHFQYFEKYRLRHIVNVTQTESSIWNLNCPARAPPTFYFIYCIQPRDIRLASHKSLRNVARNYK